MKRLPVKLLTELLTPDEIITAYHVKETHAVKFCPVGISLPDESRVSLQCYCGEEHFSEFRYTPHAFFAVRGWEMARDNLLKRPEFARALDVEWHPVSATFRSVRYVNGSPERFVAAMFDEMKRLADSSTIEIRYGRFDKPALPELPDYPRRYYIMPLEILAEKRNYGMMDELKTLQDSPAGDFSWKDIADAFVVLKPIQLAFIAGDEMNNHTPLDEELISACGDFDLKKVRELVEKGANIHAAGKYGDTAMEVMTYSYQDLEYENEDGDPRKAQENRDKFIEIAQYLLSLGYNINLAAYGESTCLGDAFFIKDLSIVKFLLDHGADPNIGSYIGEEGSGGLGETALGLTWGDYCTLDEGEDYYELELLLLRYGALPVVAGKRLTPEELDDWIEGQKEKSRWDDSICTGQSKFDDALINCAKNMLFYYMALIAQSGGNVNVRDARGRNLLRIVLEEAEFTERNRKYLKMNLAEMALMLLCGLKLKLSDAEIEQAKELCRVRGFQESFDAISAETEPFHLHP